MGKDIESVHGPRRTGDVDKTYADITGLRNLLHVEPKVNFYDGLEITVDWFVNNYKP